MSRDSTSYDESTSFNKDDDHLDAFDYSDEYPPISPLTSSWRQSKSSASRFTPRAALLASAVAVTWAITIWLTFIASQSSSPAVPDSLSPAIASLTEGWANGTQLVDFEIEGAFNGKAIKAICDQVDFVPGRWIACDNAAGGVGNVRNAVLTCLRYTIASGSSWILPTLDVRGEIVVGAEHLHTGGRQGLDFMWDVDFLKANLRRLCPKMGVADHAAHVPSYTFATFPEPLDLLSLHPTVSGEPDNGDHAGWPHQQNLKLGSFRHDFDTLFPPPESIEAPTIVRLTQTMFQWPIQVDPFEFWSSFGRLLRFKEEVQVMASQVYHELDVLQREGKAGGEEAQGYFGMHLRFEDDVADGWGTFEELTNPYMDKLLERGHTLVYVACGDQAILARFQARLAERAPHVRMTTKYALLAGRARAHARLDAMPFDVQALVDYQVLLRADYLAGTSFSSFSANLGARRHLLAGNGNARKILVEGDDGLSMLRESSWLWMMREVVWP